MSRPARAPVSAAEPLERRYRRLFACYPASYRDANEDEMLGVAMAGTRPGQRWPTWGEVRSLILGGARTRLAGLVSWARTPAWRDSCAAFTFLAAALLATISLETLTVRLLPMTTAGTARFFEAGSPAQVPLLLGGADRLTAGAFIPAVIWLLVAVTAAMGWRKAAAVGASAGAAVSAVLVVQYIGDPPATVMAWWQFVLAATAALAAVAWLAGPVGSGGGQRLSRRVMTAVAAAGVVVAAAFTFMTSPGPYVVVYSPLPGISGHLGYATLALMGAMLLVPAARLGPAVRRRVLLLSLPALAMGALVRWTFGAFLVSNPGFARPILPNAPELVILAAVPVLGLVTGMAWLRRRERAA
jgi:hypothetical protein